MSIIKNVFVFACSLQLMSCSVNKQIAKEARHTVLSDSLLASAHIGICLYDATENKYLYNYQGDKYFIPASNTKIATCYAAMKYLGDSLVGMRYRVERDSSIVIQPSGDPTFLHSDFKYQPAFAFLSEHKNNSVTLYLAAGKWEEDAWGRGWSWDDYNDDYMAERSAFPIYGNVVRFVNANDVIKSNNGEVKISSRSINVTPAYFLDSVVETNKNEIYSLGGTPPSVVIRRLLSANQFMASGNYFKTFSRDIPFFTNRSETSARLLADTLHNRNLQFKEAKSPFENIPEGGDAGVFNREIHSQPTDSLLKIMMHRSDNFFAEQSLLMVGNERIGVMNDAKIIDTLLATDYAAMPQRPQWVDGSGLSRFDLFTPQDFVFILNKMRNEFSWQRITTIFSTGGDGTLGSYYKTLHGKIFAKTGSLTNDIALSGYLITQKNKTLIFSILVNNHTVSATSVRKAVERFLTAVQRDN